MSMEFHGASESYMQALDDANLFFTILFTVEMVVKLIGFGFRNYSTDGYNNFDLFIVVFSWVEFSLLSGGGFSSLRTFRLLRVLRTLKLAKSWHSLNQLIVTIARSIPGLANFGLILMLFMFIYALFGMQFYGGQFNESNGFDEKPRTNFDSLGMSLLAVFQVVTGENWNDVLYNCMKVNGVVGAIYTSSMFCFGNYIVLNLFLAILLDNFQQSSGVSRSTFYEEMERQNDVKVAFNKFKVLLKVMARFIIPDRLHCKCLMPVNDDVKEIEMTGKEEAPPGLEGAKRMEEKEDEEKKDSSSRCLVSESSNDGDDGNGGGGNDIRQPETPQSSTNSKNGSDSGFFRRVTSSLFRKDKKDDTSYSDRYYEEDSDEDDEQPRFTSSYNASYEAPVGIRVDDLCRYVMDNAYYSLLRVHTNIVHLYMSHDPNFNGEGPLENGEGVKGAELLTESTKRSIVPLKAINSSESLAEADSDAADLGSQGSLNQRYSSLSPKTSLSPKSTARAANLESARHETMMDDDLKVDFRILRNCMRLANRSIDVKTRRMHAKTFMDSFSGFEFVEFLISNGAVADKSSAEVAGQMFLEIGLINLSVPPKKKKKKSEKREEGEENHSNVGESKFSYDRVTSADSNEGFRGNSGKRSDLENDGEWSAALFASKASALAMEWEGSAMIFAHDLSRLYTIGDITPSPISVLEPTNIQKVRKVLRKQRQAQEKYELVMTKKFSLMCLSRENKVRVFCARVICQRWFDKVILFLIIVSSILLALDEPHVSEDKTSTLYKFLYYTDFVMTGLFIAEMLLKIVGMGLFFGAGAYLKVSWNVLDFVIVLVSVAGIILAGKVDLAFLKSLRAMRGLRPLRMVSRAPSLKVVVNSIFIALPACVNVVLVVLLCFLVFAIVGSTFFSGLFYYCSGNGDIDKYGLDKIECIGTFTDSLGNSVSREWVRFPYHFDSVPRAMTTLFEIASLEMWPDIMSAARDVTEVDKAPKVDNSLNYAFFFVFFVFLGSFFVINLFVGVVINKFGQVKAEGDEKSLFLSKEQQEWVKAQKAIMKSKVELKFKSPIELSSPRRRERDAGLLLNFRLRVFRLVEHRTFDNIIMATIIVSVLTMAMPYHSMSKGYEDGLLYIDFVWNGIFITEMVLKWIGLNFKQYFASGWNRFDSFIVLCSIVDMIASGSGLDVGIDIKVLRVLRIARMVRLLRHNRPLMNIFIALYTSLPSLANVGSILLLCLYVYAVMGMNLFSDVTVDKVDGLEFIDSRINFATFGCSMLTLFRTSTGESWNGIMHELEAAGYFIAIPFFISFVVLGTFIMLNLFIAVILENFSDAQAVDENAFCHDHIEQFSLVWAGLDTEKDYFIEGFKLVNLLYSLPPPLGLKGQEHMVTRCDHLVAPAVPSEDKSGPSQHVIQYIRSLGIRRDKFGMVFFLDVLSALVRKGFNLSQMNLADLDAMNFDRLNKDLMGSLRGELRSKLSEMCGTTVICDLSDEFNSACAIQCAWRGKIQRRMFYSQCVEEGNWTPTLNNMYVNTLKVWREEASSHLPHD